MAKALIEPPPSSSVARLLDPEAANRAIARPDATTIEHHRDAARHGVAGTSHSDDTVLGANFNREFILSAANDATLNDLLSAMRRTTGTRLGASHVVRAMLLAAAHAMPELQLEVRRLGRMKLPSNARGFERQRAQFERRLAAAFVAGMRAAAALDASD